MTDTRVGTARTNTTPGSVTRVIVNVPKKEKSGLQWVGRFLPSTSTADLIQPFRTDVDDFIAALRAGGARVIISTTYRPPERVYLMHWSYKIAHGTDPSSVPAMDGVDIDWEHLDAGATPIIKRL